MIRLIASIVMLLLLIAFGVPISAAQGTTPPSGEIAFASNRSGTYQIYLMNADGSNVRQLTHEKVGAIEPIWSPDGQKLLYAKGGSLISDLVVINADGSHPLQLAANVLTVYQYVWSPDSQSIIYPVVVPSGEFSELLFHHVKPDGTHDQLLKLPRDIGFINVFFFPDGKHLLAETPNNVYTADLDGSHTQILNNQISFPTQISPDGKHIVGAQVSTIFGMDSSGKNVQQLFSGLTSTNRADLQVIEVTWLDWSPNGYYIWGAFQTNSSESASTPEAQSATFPVFIGTANGDDYWLRNLSDWHISWSPDSQWIAYTIQNADGHYQIAISQPIGTDQMTLTSGSDNSQPAWRPIP
ncbi:MAG TPA: hypothetical protein VHD90_10335 [Phototrophicaceae bacterium]|nr:hypothetical protein [Phototrophicaceae bacterium]